MTAGSQSLAAGRRGGRWGRVLVGASLAVAAAALGLRLDRGAEDGAREGGGAASPADDALGRVVVGLEVRGVDGRRVAAVPAGEPAVVMVSSVACGYCETALRDLARMAEGRPLPRLRVVTLEGAREGAAMLERFGVRGAFAAGPLGSAEQVLLTFRIPGTPVFAEVDARGRVRRVVPGYPGRGGLAALYRVMAGEAPQPGPGATGTRR